MSFGGYSNTDYDALADQLVGETDMDKRLDIYKLSLSGLTSMEKISNRAQLVEGNA